MTGSTSILDQNGRPFSRNGDGRPFGITDDGYGDFPVPHAFSFSSILSGGDKTYWHDRWDEAMAHARKSALVMRRDAFLMSLLQERKLATASLPWELEVPNERDPRQRVVRDVLRQAVEGIRDFRRIIYALLEAIWYGRYGVALKWKWITFQGKRVMTVADWYPVNGDKLGWTFAGVPYILVNPGQAPADRPDIEIVNTTAGGKGLVLKGTWREHYLIHRHEQDDADYFEAEQAAGVWGVGIRSRIFWMDWVRREYLSWITTFLERVGLGVTLWYYDGGNPEALKAVKQASTYSSRRANLFVPIFSDGKGAPKGLVERVETPVNGVDALRMLKQDIEQKMERYVVGQEASSKSDGSQGLGNQAGAKFQMATKDYITQFDARVLEETLTGDEDQPGLVWLMQKYSFPDTLPHLPDGFRVRLRFGIEKQDSEKKMRGIGQAVGWGVAVKADEVRAAAGLSKPDIGDEVVQTPGITTQPYGMAPPPAPGQPGQPGAPAQPGAPGQPPGQPGGENLLGDPAAAGGGDDDLSDLLGPEADSVLYGQLE